MNEDYRRLEHLGHEQVSEPMIHQKREKYENRARETDDNM